jgi:hypothetical protein
MCKKFGQVSWLSRFHPPSRFNDLKQWRAMPDEIMIPNWNRDYSGGSAPDCNGIP